MRSPASAALSSTTTARLSVKHGKPDGGIKKVTVPKGNTLRLTVASPDTSAEIHVHGYDIKRNLAPGRPSCNARRRIRDQAWLGAVRA